MPRNRRAANPRDVAARAVGYANRALELPPPTSDAPVRATLEQARQALAARDSLAR